MTTCTYCNCEVAPRDAGWGEDFYRHRHTSLCIKALKRRASELQIQLAEANAAIAYLNDRVAIDREAPVTQTAED